MVIKSIVNLTVYESIKSTGGQGVLYMDQPTTSEIIRRIQHIMASMHQCINASMHQFINASMHQCINASMHQCTNASMHQCINASMLIVRYRKDYRQTEHKTKTTKNNNKKQKKTTKKNIIMTLCDTYLFYC